MMVGELSLDGTLQPIKGALPIAIKARAEKYKGLIVPKQNEREAAVVNNLEVYGMENIIDVIKLLTGSEEYEPTFVDTRREFYEQQYKYELDFADVRGQENVKRALEVAAAGGHNLIMVGPPGSGKSMMAKRLPSILPPLSLAESLETTQIHSVAGKLQRGTSLISQRPFRSPHHTISEVALVGGGFNPQPGEISLAHNGVLFADELPEFNKQTLEVLRQPLEDHKITISRSKYTVEFPCSFMFVASMNPCPCGYYNDPTHNCCCTPGQIQRYMNKISGPLLDRIEKQSIICVPRSFFIYLYSMNEMAFLGLKMSKSFVREPQCNGCIERFNRTIEQEVFSVAHICSIDDAIERISKFVDDYNSEWFIHRLQMTPIEFRRAYEAKQISFGEANDIYDACVTTESVSDSQG